MDKGGKPPFMDSPSDIVSATVSVSIPKPKTIADTTTIANKEEGTALVILGKPQIISIVNKVSPSIVQKGIPDINSEVPLT